MEMDKNKIKTLPITERLKKPYWSYIYAYNLRTLRDIFVYCVIKGEINKDDFYREVIEKIPPPNPLKNQWINKKGRTKQDKERRILEYEHGARYLGLIKKEGNIIKPDFETFKEEKETIIKENKERVFGSSYISPELTQKEKEAMLNIILNYERARDFLWWFLNFSKFHDSSSFTIEEFKEEAEPIFLEKIKEGRKGSEILKRAVDGKMWKIPEEYIRLVSFVFPAWFKELGVIDKVVIFPEFSEDKKLWHMHYPIKMSGGEFLNLDIAEILESLFLKGRSERSIWIPYLLYVLVQKYYCSVKAIKVAVENIYKKDPEHFYLDRASLYAMKYAKYRGSYMKVDGFFRSDLKLFKMEG